MLRKRAKRLHGGNVSAVFAELITEIKRREAWDRAVAWYGGPLEPSRRRGRVVAWPQ